MLKLLLNARLNSHLAPSSHLPAQRAGSLAFHLQGHGLGLTVRLQVCGRLCDALCPAYQHIAKCWVAGMPISRFQYMSQTRRHSGLQLSGILALLSGDRFPALADQQIPSCSGLAQLQVPSFMLIAGDACTST